MQKCQSSCNVSSFTLLCQQWNPGVKPRYHSLSIYQFLGGLPGVMKNIYIYILTQNPPEKGLIVFPRRFPFSQNVGWKFSVSNGKAFFIHSKLTISLADQKTYMMKKEDNKMEMAILCKWTHGNFHSNRLDRKIGVPPKVVHFTQENFHLIRTQVSHLNR